MRLEGSSEQCRPFCVGLNVLSRHQKIYIKDVVKCCFLLLLYIDWSHWPNFILGQFDIDIDRENERDREIERERQREREREEYHGGWFPAVYKQCNHTVNMDNCLKRKHHDTRILSYSNLACRGINMKGDASSISQRFFPSRLFCILISHITEWFWPRN